MESYAEKVAKNCNLNSSICVESPKFNDSSLLLFSTSSCTFDDPTIISMKAVDFWFNKISSTSQLAVDKCCGSGNGNEFLSLVAQQNSAVGCALSRISNIDFMVCILSNSIKVNEPVYTSSGLAQCARKDKNFSSLCASDDVCALCENHIACNNKGQFGPSCPVDTQLLTIPSNVKGMIISNINSLRNIVASGQQPGFSSALKMNLVVSIKKPQS